MRTLSVTSRISGILLETCEVELLSEELRGIFLFFWFGSSASSPLLMEYGWGWLRTSTVTPVILGMSLETRGVKLLPGELGGVLSFFCCPSAECGLAWAGTSSVKLGIPGMLLETCKVKLLFEQLEGVVSIF